MSSKDKTQTYIPRVWQVLVTIVFVLAFIALFVPGIDYSRMTGDWPPRYQHAIESFHDANATDTIIPTMITALAMLGGIVVIWKNMAKTALGCALIYVIDEIIYIASVNKDRLYYDFTDPAAGFFLFTVLVIALLILCFMAHKKTQQEIRPTKASSAQLVQKEAVSKTDELIKYKSLLDSGAITQEEYDIKKKQLLDL